MPRECCINQIAQIIIPTSLPLKKRMILQRQYNFFLNLGVTEKRTISPFTKCDKEMCVEFLKDKLKRNCISTSGAERKVGMVFFPSFLLYSFF